MIVKIETLVGVGWNKNFQSHTGKENNAFSKLHTVYMN